MSGNIYSLSGVQIAMSTEKANADLDAVAFALLTFTDIGNVGSLGSYGVDTNVISYDMLSTVVSRKAKGISNAGDPELECARSDTDAGQLLLRAAGLPTVYDAYAFKVTKQDGSIDYLRGLVMGPTSPNGGPEDFDLHVYKLGLNQVPVHVVAPGP